MQCSKTLINVQCKAQVSSLIIVKCCFHRRAVKILQVRLRALMPAWIATSCLTMHYEAVVLKLWVVTHLWITTQFSVGGVAVLFGSRKVFCGAKWPLQPKTLVTVVKWLRKHNSHVLRHEMGQRKKALNEEYHKCTSTCLLWYYRFSLLVYGW